MTDEFEGGETTFPRLGLQVKVKRGDLLVWRNMHIISQEEAAEGTRSRREDDWKMEAEGVRESRTEGWDRGAGRAAACDRRMDHSSNPIVTRRAGTVGGAGGEGDVVASNTSTTGFKLAWQKW